jgi:hypothetical protein
VGSLKGGVRVDPASSLTVGGISAMLAAAGDQATGERTMAITVRWGDEDRTVVYMLFEGEWTVEDYLTASGEVAALMDEVEHPVALIADALAAVMPEGLISRFPQMKGAPYISHPNYWLVVVIVAPGFAYALADIYSSVFLSPSRYARADTPEEAYAIIEERRAQRDASPDD